MRVKSYKRNNNDFIRGNWNGYKIFKQRICKTTLKQLGTIKFQEMIYNHQGLSSQINITQRKAEDYGVNSDINITQRKRLRKGSSRLAFDLFLDRRIINYLFPKINFLEFLSLHKKNIQVLTFYEKLEERQGIRHTSSLILLTFSTLPITNIVLLSFTV